MRNGIQRDAGFHFFFVLYNRTSAVFIWRLMGSSASSKRISHSGTIPHALSAVRVVRMGLLGVTRRWRECMRLVVCLYNRTSAVVRVPPVSRGRQANPVLTYITALRRFIFGDGDGNQKAKATAEGRLYNHSPRLACLPGVSRGIIIYRRRAVV